MNSAFTLHVPRGSYRLDHAVISNHRLVHLEQEDGVTLSGAGVAAGAFYLDRVNVFNGNSQTTSINAHKKTITGIPNIGDTKYVINNTGSVVYGDYSLYINEGLSSFNKGGGDIARFTIANWPNLVDGTGLFGQWHITVSPRTKDSDGAANFGMVAAEFDVVHNGRDQGWHANIGVPQGAYGPDVVPDPWVPTGRLGGNIQHGWAVAPGGVNNRAKNYPTAYSSFTPTLLTSDKLSVNGITVSFINGNSLAQIVSSINSAAIPNVSASIDVVGRLAISSLNGADLNFLNVSGTPLSSLGYNANYSAPSNAPSPASYATGPGATVNGTYAPFIAYANATAPGGRSFYAVGDNTGAQPVFPYAPFGMAGTICMELIQPQ